MISCNYSSQLVSVLPDWNLKVSSSKAGGSLEGRGGGESSSEDDTDLWVIGGMSNEDSLLPSVSVATSTITSVVDICLDVVASLTDV